MQIDNHKDIELETKRSWEFNWSSVGQKEISEIFGYPRVKKLMQIYLEHLSKDGLILEAGCGLGQWVGYFKSRGFRMIGIDYNLSTIQQAKSYNRDLALAVADVRTLPFQSNSIGTYLSLGVIEHFIEGPDAALKEAYRVLKEGGKAIIAVPHKNIFTIIKSPIIALKRSELLRKIFSKEEKCCYFQRYFKNKELEAKFLEIGFKKLIYKPVDHIFSLVEFSKIFRDKNTFDGESNLAIKLGDFFEKYFPKICAGSNLFVLQK